MLNRLKVIARTIARRYRMLAVLLIIVLLWSSFILLTIVVTRTTVALWRAGHDESGPLIGQFSQDGKADPALSAHFAARSRLLAKRQLPTTKEDAESPIPGVDLASLDAQLDELQLSTKPETTVKSALDTFERAELQVGALNISSLVALAVAFNKKSRTVIEGDLAKFGDRYSLDMRFKMPGRPVVVIPPLQELISARGPKTGQPVGAGDESPEVRALERLLDRAVFEVALALKKSKTPTRESETPTLSAVAFSALQRARHHLEQFARSGSYRELQNAQTELRTLVEAAPQFVDGLLLLGFALSVDRREGEAMEAYERAVIALGPQTAQRRLFDARFLSAKARMREHTWAAAKLAADEQEQLVKDLSAITAPSAQPGEGAPNAPTQEDLTYYRLLLAKAKCGCQPPTSEECRTI